MHLPRFRTIPALTILGLSISVWYVAQSPLSRLADRHSPSINSVESRGSSPPASEVEEDDSAVEPLSLLEDLRIQAGILKATARFFRERRRIADSDPESAEAKVGFDFSVSRPGTLDDQKISRGLSLDPKTARRDVFLVMDTALLNPTSIRSKPSGITMASARVGAANSPRCFVTMLSPASGADEASRPCRINQAPRV